MGQNFSKNTYHATGQAAYLDLEAAENNFDALASSFCGPQDPAALGFSEPGMLWLNNSTGILSQRNESNSAWVTLFDLRNQRVATGRVTAASIANGARKPSLVAGQAIAPGSCSLHSPYVAALNSLAAAMTAGNYRMFSLTSYAVWGADPASLAGYSSYERVMAIRINRSGTIKTRLRGTSSVNVWFRGIIARNGVAVGTLREEHLLNKTWSDSSWVQDISGWSAGDLVEVYVDEVAPYQLGANLDLFIANPHEPALFYPTV